MVRQATLTIFKDNEVVQSYSLSPSSGTVLFVTDKFAIYDYKILVDGNYESQEGYLFVLSTGTKTVKLGTIKFKYAALWVKINDLTKYNEVYVETKVEVGSYISRVDTIPITESEQVVLTPNSYYDYVKLVRVYDSGSFTTTLTQHVFDNGEVVKIGDW